MALIDSTDTHENRVLLKRENKDLNRRYREAILEQKAMTNSRFSEDGYGSNRLQNLVQSFGQEVQEIQIRQMPEVREVLKVISRSHPSSSSTDQTSWASSAVDTESSRPSKILEVSRDPVNTYDSGRQEEVVLVPDDGQVEEREPQDIEEDDEVIEIGFVPAEFALASEHRHANQEENEEEPRDNLPQTSTRIDENDVVDVASSEVRIDEQSPVIHSATGQGASSEAFASELGEEKVPPNPSLEDSEVGRHPRASGGRYRMEVIEGKIVNEEWPDSGSK